jgi:hypothetical protein
MQSITTKIRANKISKIPKIIDQNPPIKLDTIEVAKVNMAKANKKMMATTNAIIGEYLGKHWVKVILKSPSPMAIMNV